MKALRAWWFTIRIFGRYFLFRMKLAAPPNLKPDFENIQYLVGMFVGWNKYLRVVNPELCPTDHAAIFYGNHQKLDDPFYLFRASYLASKGEVALHAMFRDDFFKGTILKSWFIDMDDFMTYLQTWGISRGNVTLAQLKIFLNLLENGESFILYPGRTRTCSGLLMEYRDGVDEPGGISFFLAQMQRRRPDLPISAMPVSRNYNPVTKHSSVIYGPEQYLEPGANREAQRAFDRRLIEVLADLVELSVPQLLAANLYMRCLHRLSDTVRVEELIVQVCEVVESTTHPYIDPEGREDVERAVRAALVYFAKRGMLRVQGDRVSLDTDAILKLPELTTKFQKENPVRYLTNQLIHLREIVSLTEEAVLELADRASHTSSG